MSAPASRKASSRLVVRALYLVGGLLGLLVLGLAGLRFYFEHNKARIVADLNEYITENINGTMRIGGIDLKLLTGFPTLSLTLTDVELNDNIPASRRLLKAKEMSVGLNVMRLFHREIDVQSILIDGATIDLFTDADGLTNFNIIKPQPPGPAPAPGRSAPALLVRDVELRRVDFKAEDLREKKLFHLVIDSLRAPIDYEPDGLRTRLKLKVLARSMTFLSTNGSFIKDQPVAGVLKAAFSKSTRSLTVETDALAIGKDSFAVKGRFAIGQKPALFDLDIRTRIRWRNASRLLSDNVQRILDQLDVSKPLEARCVIHGDLNDKRDPAIVVNADVKNSELRIPDGVIADVSFRAEFTNHHDPGKPNGDPNSAVILSDFTGAYGSIPFQIPGATLVNLLKPVASGTLQTEFGLPRLNELIDEQLILFSGGQARVNLEFQVAIDELKLHQPRFKGEISVSQGDLLYKPKNLRLKTDVDLAFTDRALTIRNVKYASGPSTLLIDGEVENFFSLYYDAPEKMVVALNVRSPFLNAKTFLGTEIVRKDDAPPDSVAKEGATRKLRSVIDTCQMVLNMRIDKAVYEHLEATNARAQIVLANSRVNVRNGSVETSGGKFAFDGHLVPQGAVNVFGARVKITSCDIPRFLKSFNNFGITAFAPENITGDLSADASVSGSMTSGGDLVGGSLKGDLKYQIVNGSLMDFEPIINVGKKFFVKLLFGKRNFGHIAFGELAGDFKVDGHRVDVDVFRVSSNVLNFDVMGIYSFKQGTNLGLTIPLRDPEDDARITDKAERDKVRYKGIVLHLVAVDGKDGGIEVKTGKYKKDETRVPRGKS
jgi:AsmA-like C-terminal region/AsmA family